MARLSQLSGYIATTRKLTNHNKHNEHDDNHDDFDNHEHNLYNQDLAGETLAMHWMPLESCLSKEPSIC